MKLISKQLLLHIAITAMAFPALGNAENRESTALSQRDLYAKLVYCKTCHGLAGQGYRGSSPMPRLAGQQTEYLENQLLAFVEHRRKNSVMFNAVSGLSPAMIKAVAEHFKDLNPKPLEGAPREQLLATGKKLYEEGVPGVDIQPCSTCHGPDAKGDGASPRLAGQLPDYTFKALVNWSKERGQDLAKPDMSAIMEPFAQSLTEAQVSAVAAYLGSLE
jgi:cytochrome c553